MQMSDHCCCTFLLISSTLLRIIASVRFICSMRLDGDAKAPEAEERNEPVTSGWACTMTLSVVSLEAGFVGVDD